MIKIEVKKIRSYAYHGCLNAENKIGGEYTTDVIIEASVQKSFSTDHLSDTIDYCQIYNVVQEQMKIKSNLIEHVANRIANHIIKISPLIDAVTVVVSKINPPLNGDIAQVNIELKLQKTDVLL